MGAVLGKGGFGEVREGIRKADGEKVAIKVISKLKFASEEDHANMITEVELFRRVSQVPHENLVRLLDYYEDKYSFFLVTDICMGGELMDKIISMQSFSEADASYYFKQMLLAIKQCHEHNICHRDLKPENFLLASKKPKATLKLTDFGLAADLPKGPQETILNEACGSAYYIAPEIFRRKYTVAVDAWAAGVILFLLLSGTVPFGNSAENESAIYKSIQRDPLVLGQAWDGISSAARELVTGLLEKDPSKRYTIDQALEHPWVASHGVAPEKPLDRKILSSLISFNAKNKFKKEAMRLVASTLSAADVQSLKTEFHRIDTDNTGYITFAEMSAAMAGQNIGQQNKKEIEEMMKRLDVDGDGKISWQEFLQATAEQQMVHHQNNIWWAFCEYDKDGDGEITLSELKLMLKDEDPEKLAKYIAEYDSDGSGTINYEEFMRMLLPKDLKYRISKGASNELHNACDK
jgi:calcium-dependent protein kinase